MAQTAGVVGGHLMGIYISNVLIGAMKNVKLSLSSKTNDMNNAGSGDFDTIKPARRTFTATGSGHFQFDATYGYQELFAAWKAGTKLSLRFSTENPGDYDYSGDGYITQLDADFPDHENSTYSFTIQGTSDVTEATNT